MARVQHFALPDLGEGLTEGEILQWLVQPGDTVLLNQPVVEVETAKAAVELPSPFAGVVAELHCGPGDTVDVGSVILSVDTEPGAPREQAQEGFLPAVVAGAVATDGSSLPADDAAPSGRTAVLVGYGPRSGAARRRTRRDAPAVPVPVEAQPPPPPATAARVSAAAVGQAAARASGAVTVLAKPPVRRLARERGVDLTALVGTGPGGTVTRRDVEAAAAVPGEVVRPAGQDRAGQDRGERRVAVTGVRRRMAEAMAGSVAVPQVTVFVTVDMTASMELLARLRTLPEFAGRKLGPLLLVAKALLLAVRRNPEINSTFTGDEIVVKDAVHLGIAAATPRGLLVPCIRDADRLSLPELAGALQDLAETARAGRTAPADMAGGTITITNVGVFGVDTGTPILNPGESAILCLGVVRPTPWVHEGSVAVRQVTQLAMSFDHRHIDGQLGSRFLSDIARVLTEPATALAWS